MAELGETHDPRALIPGDPGSVVDTARGMGEYGDALHEAGAGLKRIDTQDGWSGEAAEQFRDLFQGQPTQWLQAGDCFHDAANALSAYESTLQWAQQQAVDAIRLWDEGNAATQQAQAQHAQQIEQAQQQLPHVAGGKPAQVDIPFVDPGEAKRQAARGVLDRARSQLASAGETAADAVGTARDQAPQKPGLWSHVGDFLKSTGHAAEEVGAGVVNGVASFAHAVATHPMDVVGTAEGVVIAAAGIGGEAGGGLVSATGIGAALGVPAMAVSVPVVATGVGLAGGSMIDLARHAAGDDHVSPMQVNSTSAGGSAEPPFPPPEEITGTTEHGEARILDREGHGVNDAAVQDAVNNPTKPPQFRPDQYGGSYRYVGKDAIVNLNKDGKVTTAWATSRAGWRNP